MAEITTMAEMHKIRLRYPKYIIRFSASWCGPCKRMNQDELVEAAQEAKIPIFSIDVDNEELKEVATITQVPTFILFVGGEESLRRISSETAKVAMWIRKLA